VEKDGERGGEVREDREETEKVCARIRETKK